MVFPITAVSLAAARTCLDATLHVCRAECAIVAEVTNRQGQARFTSIIHLQYIVAGGPIIDERIIFVTIRAKGESTARHVVATAKPVEFRRREASNKLWHGTRVSRIIILAADGMCNAHKQAAGRTLALCERRGGALDAAKRTCKRIELCMGRGTSSIGNNAVRSRYP